jgi:ABC-type branched-subunit amino acid transport system substrate-binding protein
MAMQALVAGIERAGTTDPAQVAQAMLGLSYETPIGTQTIDATTHDANRGQFWGRMVRDDQYPFAVMSEITYMDPGSFTD